MFAQVFQGKTSDPQAVMAAFDRWMRDLAPGAIGWLGSTTGVTDDGTVVAMARFESADAAARNSARPEQGQWWQDTERLFDGEVSFRDSEDVDLDLVGDPDRAGFVQVMQGQVSDPARAKELMSGFSLEQMKEMRPDILGSVMIGQDQGRWTQFIYFTSEAEAREAEKREMPAEMQATMEELGKISLGETEFFDLRNPMLVTAKGS
jgi:hypothetical protein